MARISRAALEFFFAAGDYSRPMPPVTDFGSGTIPGYPTYQDPRAFASELIGIYCADSCRRLYQEWSGMVNRKAHLAHDVEMDVKNDIKAAKKIPRLPWWAVLCVIIISILMDWLFYHLGRFNLALPTLDGIVVFGLVIAVKWTLRRRVWFWITMTGIAALHILLILYVPWTTKWVPAAAIAGIVTIDVCVVFVILAVVEKLLERFRTSET
jgi:hypothetical protein